MDNADDKINAVNAISSISKVQPVSFFHGDTTKEKFYDKLLKESNKKNKMSSKETNPEKKFQSLTYLLYK